MEVQHVADKAHKDALLPSLVQPGPALVYAATRRNVEAATRALRTAGVRAGMYHAGLAKDDRARVQDDFMGGRLPVVVATNAFGMGIDKKDIRAIVHYDMPGTVEAYYQEIGRAGRDGRTSRAVLLYKRSDRRIHEFFIDGAHPPAAWVHRLYAHLRSLGTNPVFLPVEELARALPEEADDRAVHACIPHPAPGRRRPPHRSRRTVPVSSPSKPGRPVAPPQGMRGEVWRHLIDTVGIKPGRSREFQLRLWARDLGIQREQLTACLRALEDRGYLRFQAPGRHGGVELVDPDMPLELDEAKIKARRSREYAKLDRMEAYTSAPCRRRYVIEYFGEAAPYEGCGTCDACLDGAPVDTPRPLSPEEEAVVLKVLACVARMQRKTGKPAWGVSLVAKTLIGSKARAHRAVGLPRAVHLRPARPQEHREVEARRGRRRHRRPGRRRRAWRRATSPAASVSASRPTRRWRSPTTAGRSCAARSTTSRWSSPAGRR